MIRVLLADDHPVVRSGTARLLEQGHDIRVVMEADAAETAYRGFVDLSPDVLITDLAMPGVGGLSLITRVLMRQRHAAVLVFSMYDSGLLVRRALDAGARGFVSKAAPPERVIDAVRAVHAGLRYVDDGLSPVKLGIDAETDTDASAEAQRLSTLSAGEFETFCRLAQGHSLAECARLLHLSEKTISNHQTVIRDKLGMPSLAAWTHLALRHRLITV